MKKIINLGQKLRVEYSCQVCHKNKAVIKPQGSAWLAQIQVSFCERLCYWKN